MNSRVSNTPTAEVTPITKAKIRGRTSEPSAFWSAVGGLYRGDSNEERSKVDERCGGSGASMSAVESPIMPSQRAETKRQKIQAARTM